MKFRKKTKQEAAEVRKAKKQFNMLKREGAHENGQLELLRALVDSVKHCNFGNLVVKRL